MRVPPEPAQRMLPLQCAVALFALTVAGKISSSRVCSHQLNRKLVLPDSVSDFFFLRLGNTLSPNLQPKSNQPSWWFE